MKRGKPGTYWGNIIDNILEKQKNVSILLAAWGFHHVLTN